MRISLSLKFGLLSAMLMLVVAGATTYVLVYQFGGERRRELVAHDRELARMLAGLHGASGRLDFGTLSRFVDSAHQVDLGLVYALELDGAGNLVQGALNPRLFGHIDAEYRKLLARGDKEVLRALAGGGVERQGLIKEYAFRVLDRQLRLGFDFHRIDRQIARQREVGLSILALGLLLGVIASVLVARSTTRPLRQLVGAMAAVASGDMNQTVAVSSHDELASLARSFNQMMRHLRVIRQARELAAAYSSPEVVERALAAGAATDLAVEERAVTVLSIRFESDRPGGRRAAPRELLSRLNDHLAPVLDTLLREGATVVSLSGCALLAVWGVPGDEPRAEWRALVATAEVRDLLERMATRSAAAGVGALRVAAGIATGRAAAGNVGSLQRFSFSVVGEPVDHARAIEAMARPGEILLSEATYTKVGERVTVQACSPLTLDDRDEALPLYRLVKS